MFSKANFYLIPYTFLNQIGGKQQESKLHIKLHVSSKHISPHVSVAFFSILKRVMIHEENSMPS